MQMRNFLWLVTLLSFHCIAKASSVPAQAQPVPTNLVIASAHPSTGLTQGFPSRKAIEKLIGRKLTFKERVALKLQKIFYKKNPREMSDDALRKKANWSLILGIAGIVFVFLPLGPILSVAAIITALILGYQVRRQDPTNKKAKAGIILAWVGVGVLIAAVAIAVSTLFAL